MTPEYGLSFAREDACELSGVALSEALRACVDTIFADAERADDDYGSVHQLGPDRDTQFQVVKRRAVLRRFTFGAGQVTCELGHQESVDGPLEEGAVSAWSLGVTTFGLPWSWLEPRAQRLREACAGLGMRDISVGVHAEDWVEQAKAHDPEGLPGVLRAQREVALARVRDPEARSLDLQRMPLQDLGALLEAVEAPERITSLSLNASGLRALPEAVRRFTKLRWLYVYNNPLRELPAWIGELEELREVNLHTTRVDVDAARALLPEGCRIRS